ncbi:MAG TPA: SOS response-associated peptidase [bacterium]|nr:SOS response-associated peptidase [bacterium]
MCGRYTQTAPYPKLADRFGLPSKGPKLKPRYNIAPTQDVPVIVKDPNGGPHLEIMHWGLVPHWAKDPKVGYKMINARAETLKEKPSFRAPLQSRRCIVPATGFFEWKREGARKTPMYFTAADGEPLGLAGLWETWKTPDGGLLRSFTIITTEANGLLKPIHDRMPVILGREDEAAWMDAGDVSVESLLRMLKPCAEGRLTGYAVGTLVNSPKNDSEACLSQTKTPSPRGITSR